MTWPYRALETLHSHYRWNRASQRCRRSRTQLSVSQWCERDTRQWKNTVRHTVSQRASSMQMISKSQSAICWCSITWLSAPPHSLTHSSLSEGQRVSHISQLLWKRCSQNRECMQEVWGRNQTKTSYIQLSGIFSSYTLPVKSLDF